jgi:hypothetical protein
MAWNPSPEVALARDLAAKLGADEVVIVYVNFSKEQMGSITYGKTQAMCGHAKKLGDVAYDAVHKYLGDE